MRRACHLGSLLPQTRRTLDIGEQKVIVPDGNTAPEPMPEYPTHTCDLPEPPGDTPLSPSRHSGHRTQRPLLSTPYPRAASRPIEGPQPDRFDVLDIWSRSSLRGDESRAPAEPWHWSDGLTWESHQRGTNRFSPRVRYSLHKCGSPSCRGQDGMSPSSDLEIVPRSGRSWWARRVR